MDCPVWPRLDLGDLSREWLARTAGGRYPFQCTFELTERCNLACVHCFINQPAGSRAARGRELTGEQVGSILRQAAELGCLEVLLTGGEPLLRADFSDLLRRAKEEGLLVTLFTNGTLVTRQMADVLAEWPPNWLEISLYGATEQTYERVTQVPGSYARCMRGIELALEKGLRLSLKSIVLDLNHAELKAMQAFARGLGVPFRYDAVLWPRFDGGQQPVAHRLPVGAIAALDRDDPGRLREWGEILKAFGPVSGRTEYVYGCGAGHHGFHVDSAGRLSPCMMARRPSYNLLEGSLKEGWDTFLGSLREMRREADSPCRRCPIALLCVQCPGWSQAVHGDDETPVGFVCELAHRRAAYLETASI